jgi:hypothetical protein
MCMLILNNILIAPLWRPNIKGMNTFAPVLKHYSVKAYKIVQVAKGQPWSLQQLEEVFNFMLQPFHLPRRDPPYPFITKSLP